jgi:hypothetical protein
MLKTFCLLWIFRVWGEQAGFFAAFGLWAGLRGLQMGLPAKGWGW